MRVGRRGVGRCPVLPAGGGERPGRRPAHRRAPGARATRVRRHGGPGPPLPRARRVAARRPGRRRRPGSQAGSRRGRPGGTGSAGVAAPRTSAPRPGQGRRPRAAAHVVGLAGGPHHRVEGDDRRPRDRLPLARRPDGRGRGRRRGPLGPRGDGGPRAGRSLSQGGRTTRRRRPRRPAPAGGVRAAGHPATGTGHHDLPDRAPAGEGRRCRLRRTDPGRRRRPCGRRRAVARAGHGRHAGGGRTTAAPAARPDRRECPSGWS